MSQTTQATATRYRWLACNPDGTVTPLADIGLPSPVWNVVPPPIPGNPPVVQAEIEIPNPEGTPYGEAYWVKIYKTEAEDAVVLDDGGCKGNSANVRENPPRGCGLLGIEPFALLSGTAAWRRRSRKDV